MSGTTSTDYTVMSSVAGTGDGGGGLLKGTFPPGFIWSTATAATQIEGAWKADGKSESIWDRFTTCEDNNIADGSTTAIACNSYHQYKDDVRMMKMLRVTHYRFSIAWTRILPQGNDTVINQAGIDYYNRLINELLANNITPMVTLYHWDLPQILQDKGGWCSEETIQHFARYADICFKNFGDRVPYWITFNEPEVFVYLGYVSGYHAPGKSNAYGEALMAAHNVIKAHAKVYRMYKEKYTAQNGKVGITINSDWAQPKDPNNPEHVAAAERAMICKAGWFADPVFGVAGDYSPEFKYHLNRALRDLTAQDDPEKVVELPTFTEEEKQKNRKSADFFGLNHYTTRLVENRTDNSPSEVFGIGFGQKMFDLVESVDPAWKRGASAWLYVVPWGIRKNIQWITKRYNNIPVIVTENGVSDHGETEDELRMEYYTQYINEVLKAIRLDGSNVQGYTAWSLMDNFEWAEGYTEHFGLFSVRFDDEEFAKTGTRDRVAKSSVKTFADIVGNNGFL